METQSPEERTTRQQEESSNSTTINNTNNTDFTSSSSPPIAAVIDKSSKINNTVTTMSSAAALLLPSSSTTAILSSSSSSSSSSCSSSLPFASTLKQALHHHEQASDRTTTTLASTTKLVRNHYRYLPPHQQQQEHHHQLQQQQHPKQKQQPKIPSTDTANTSTTTSTTSSPTSSSTTSTGSGGVTTSSRVLEKLDFKPLQLPIMMNDSDRPTAPPNIGTTAISSRNTNSLSSSILNVITTTTKSKSAAAALSATIIQSEESVVGNAAETSESSTTTTTTTTTTTQQQPQHLQQQQLQHYEDSVSETTNSQPQQQQRQQQQQSPPQPEKDPALALRDELYQSIQVGNGVFDWMEGAIGDGIWYLDMINDVVWYSPSYKALFGYEDHEIPNISSWWRSNIFPEDLLVCLKAFKHHMKEKKPFDVVVRHKHKAGGYVWVRCDGKAIWNEKGIPVRMVGAHNDITALMNVQRTLQEKEEVLDLLCTTSLDGYWDWNITSGYLHLSTRFKNLLGYDESDLVNRIETWWFLVHPDDLLKLQSAISHCQQQTTTNNNNRNNNTNITNNDNNNNNNNTATSPPLLHITVRYVRKDGSIAHILTQGVVQSKEMIDSRLSQALFPQSLLSLASSSNHSSTNQQHQQSWVRMFGTHTDVSYIEETRAAQEANAAKTTFLATMSHEIRTPLNAVLGMAQVLLTTKLTDEQKDCVMILHHSGKHLLALINDILDFSQIEAGIISLAKEYIPIQCILRDVMIDTCAAATASSATTRLLGGDDDQQSSSSSEVEEPILLSFETDIPLKYPLYGDKDRIRQIFVNLIGNAIKFTRRGSVQVSIRPKLPSNATQTTNTTTSTTTSTTIPTLSTTTTTSSSLPVSMSTSSSSSAGDDDGGVIITIRDTGCGIAEDQLHHIFDNFCQAGYEIRTRYGGTGLGLSICTKLITAMGGTITVQSVLGEGSTFTVTLPTWGPSVAPTSSHTPTSISSTHPSHPSSVTIQKQSLAMETNSQTPVRNDSTVMKPNVVHSAEKPSDSGGRHVVYLYEELRYAHGSIQGALVAAGIDVRFVQCISDITEHIRDIESIMSDLTLDHSPSVTSTVTTSPVVVVVHNQSNTISSRVEGFVQKILSVLPSISRRPVQLYDVGHKGRPIIPAEHETIYYPLPMYPTSDELHDMIVNNMSTDPKFHKRFNIQGRSASAKDLTIPSNNPENPEKILRILLAEDNVINQKVMLRLLSRFPCTVEIANNGIEAIERAQNDEWDLIFMDWIMPHIDGLEAAKIIRETDKATPIIALTGNVSSRDRDACFRVGMNDFITKPISLESLKTVLYKVSNNIPFTNQLIG